MKRALLLLVMLTACDDPQKGTVCAAQHVERVTTLMPRVIGNSVILVPITHDQVLCDRWVSK